MNNKFTTYLITIILIILICGSVIFGIAIYQDITGENSKSEIFKLGNIITEEPEQKQDRSLEISSSNMTLTQEKTEENISEATENNTTDITINKYFYNQLVGNQKTIYDKLLENKDKLKLGNYKIEYKDAFSDIITTEEGKEQLGNDYQTAIEAFMHDNPELFYVDVNKMLLNI